MLVRAIALSLALLIGIGVVIPLATNDVEAGPRKHKKQRKHYKKYSKKWWRQYRARQKRIRAQKARARALRLRQIRLAAERANTNGQPVAAKATRPDAPKPVKAVLPTGDSAPAGWSAAKVNPAELRFRVDDSSGAQVGSASISVVGPAVPSAFPSAAKQTLGGVATTALRRDVINQMIQENGWVVNDYQKEIAGRPVYVVVAQSQARNGQVQSRMFYFTEVDGRIYNVATNSPAEQAERLAEESEKVLGSIQNRVRATQRASVREEK